MRWGAPGSEDTWRSTHPSVTMTSATSPEGRTVRFVHNWSRHPVAVSIPRLVRDVLAGNQHKPGDRLELGPWDVRVLVEE